MQLTIHSDFCNSQFKEAVHAFRQWVFPFAKYYLTDLNLLGRPNLDDESDLNEVAGYNTNLILKLKKGLDRYKINTLGNQDIHTRKANFTSALRSSDPFYVWSNKN